MNPWLVAAALVLAAAGALLAYLGSPNQRLRARPLSPRPAMAAGAALSLFSLVLLLRTMGTATAFFVLVVALMFVWTILPFAALLLRGAKDKRA